MRRTLLGIILVLMIISLNPLRVNVAYSDGQAVTTKVLIVADEEFQQRWGTDWPQTAAAIIEHAGIAFNQQFQIKLAVPANNYRTWNSPDEMALEDLLYAVKDAYPRPRGQIVIALTGQADPKYYGFALPESGVAIIQDEGNLEQDWITAQHEISHLFGAPDHAQPKHCLMDLDGYKHPGQWSADCQAIIKANRAKWINR